MLEGVAMWEVEKVVIGENGAVHTELRRVVTQVYGRPNAWWSALILGVGLCVGGSFGWFVRPSPSMEEIQCKIDDVVEAERERADREIASVQTQAKLEIRRVTAAAIVAMSDSLAILERRK